MNPWEIFGWVAVVCLSLVLIALTVTSIVGMIRNSARGRRASKTIYRGKRD